MRLRTLTAALLFLVAPATGDAQQTSFVVQQRPAWLGVSYDLRWVMQQDRCEPEVLVERVVHGSPAERAGLRAGDILLALEGEPVGGDRLQALGARLAVGDSIRLRIARNGAVQELVAVADRRPPRPPEVTGIRTGRGPLIFRDGERLVATNVDAPRGGASGYWYLTEGGRTEYRLLGRWSHSAGDEDVATLLRCAQQSERHGAATLRVNLEQVQRRADSLRVVITRRALDRNLFDGFRGVAGAELVELEPELAAYFPNARDGLLVLRVSDSSPGHRAGLRPGDVILRADGRRLDSVEGLGALLSSRTGPTDLTVVRRGRTITLTVRQW